MHHRTSTSSHAGPSGRQQEQMVSAPRPRRQTALPSRRQARIQAFGGGGVGGITISVPARPHVKEKEQEMQLGLEQTESAGGFCTCRHLHPLPATPTTHLAHACPPTHDPWL